MGGKFVNLFFNPMVQSQKGEKNLGGKNEDKDDDDHHHDLQCVHLRRWCGRNQHLRPLK